MNFFTCPQDIVTGTKYVKRGNGLEKVKFNRRSIVSVLSVCSFEPRVNNDVAFSVGSHTKMHNKREKNDDYLKCD